MAKVPPPQLDLPDAIIIGNIGFFFDILSIIPLMGTLFLLVAYGIFKFKGLKAPFPAISSIVELLPLISIFPTCGAYVWRVYFMNKPGSSIMPIKNPIGAVTSELGKVLPGPGSPGFQVPTTGAAPTAIKPPLRKVA